MAKKAKHFIHLSNGKSMEINTAEWSSVVDRKEFDANETEIVRVMRHKDGMVMRVYVMRAVKIGTGDQTHMDTKELHELVVGEFMDVALKGISECGLKRITSI